MNPRKPLSKEVQQIDVQKDDLYCALFIEALFQKATEPPEEPCIPLEDHANLPKKLI